MWFGPPDALGAPGSWPGVLGAPTATYGGGAAAVALWAEDTGQIAADAQTCLVLDGVITAPDHLRADAVRGPAEAALAIVARTRRPEALDGLRGGFALLVADLAVGLLRVRTDPFGFRGLLYAPARGGWVASNDLAAVVSLADRPAVDLSAVARVLSFYSLPGPHTLIAPVRTVPPGTELELKPGGEPGSRRYHRLEFRPEPDSAPLANWEDATDAALDAALVRVRLRSRTVGVLLSGGVDSSLLAAKAMRAGFDRCVAYTAELVGHDNPELERARRAARHLGIEHRVVPVRDQDIHDTADRVVLDMQAPGADGGFVYAALFRAAAGDVDLLLHGEAADTLFGSIIQRRFGRHVARHSAVAWMPRPVRRALAGLVGDPRRGYRHALHELLAYDPRGWAARVLRRECATAPSLLVPGAPRDPTYEAEFLESCVDPRAPSASAYVNQVVLYGSCRYRWQWIDRLARSHGLGLSFPYLDDAVLSVARRLPPDRGFDGTTTKPVLRSVAARYLPAGFAAEPKLAFPTPTEAWLRGPLHHWVEAVERPDARVRRLLDPAVLDRLRWPADVDLIREVVVLERFLRLFLDTRV